MRVLRKILAFFAGHTAALFALLAIMALVDETMDTAVKWFMVVICLLCVYPCYKLTRWLWPSPKSTSEVVLEPTQPPSKPQPVKAVKTPQRLAPKKKTRSSGYSLVAGEELDISYVDYEGERSERVIKLRNLSMREDNLYVNAICQRAGAFRSFRADRIESLTILSTGEYVSDPEEYLLTQI